VSENLPARVSAFREALGSTGSPRLGSMGASNAQHDEDVSTIPTSEGREMARARFRLEEEQKETVSLVESTNRRMGELYISGNTELRVATGQIMEENDKLTSERHKAVCDTFEKFMTEDLGVNLVEDTRWGKSRVQESAVRFLVPETPKPQNVPAKPQEMVLRRRTRGGVLKSLLGKGEEIWEVDTD
jgi:hypothetical protein